MHEISITGGTQFMIDALTTEGFPEDHATQIADVVMDSELRGHADHGLFFFRSILKWPVNR